MILLVRVIIVNIFHEHAVKQSYVVSIYSIHKATKQKLHFITILGCWTMDQCVLLDGHPKLF